MASSNEGGTAAAVAEQLGSMSIGKSGERKEDIEAKNTKPTTKNGTPTPTKMCSACGKKSNTLKKCTACKCVWYCDKKCQNKHRKVHKHECKRIRKELDQRGGKLDLGTELDIGPRGEVPPREECPICMHVLPIHTKLHLFFACCGKRICGSCSLQHQKRTGKLTCAFCRDRVPESGEEYFELLRNRVELNDRNALRNMGGYYGFGEHGVPVDQAKCIDLFRQAADLGCPSAHAQLGVFHSKGEMGLEQNEEEAHKYWKKAAEGGDLSSMYNVGSKEGRDGNDVAAMRNLRLAASGGYAPSMKTLIGCFENGLLQHGDLAETLQAKYAARAEMKSDDRDEYIEYLKITGEYKAEYDH